MGKLVAASPRIPITGTIRHNSDTTSASHAIVEPKTRHRSAMASLAVKLILSVAI